jgi:hypothetical protein
VKFLKRIWARLTGAQGDTPIDDLGASLDFGGTTSSYYYPSEDDDRPPH